MKFAYLKTFVEYVAKWTNHMIPEGMKLNKNQDLYKYKKNKRQLSVIYEKPQV